MPDPKRKPLVVGQQPAAQDTDPATAQALAMQSGPVDVSHLSDAEWEEYKRANDRIMAGKGTPGDAAYVAGARTSGRPVDTTVQSPTVYEEAAAERDAPGASPQQVAAANQVLAPRQPVVAPAPPPPAQPSPAATLVKRAALGGVPGLVVGSYADLGGLRRRQR